MTIQVDPDTKFEAVSVSKVVEILGNNLCMVCFTADDYEIDVLGSIFHPIPIDEVLSELVLDLKNDNEDGLNRLFDMVKDLQGEYSLKVRKEDYGVWRDSYLDDLSEIIFENAPHENGKIKDDLEINVLIMKKAPSLVFVLIADCEQLETTNDPTEEDEDEYDEELPLVEDDIDDEEEFDQ